MAKATKVTNKTKGPKGAYLKGVLVWAQPGQQIEADDFDENWFTEGVLDADDADDGVDLAELIAAAVQELDGEDDDAWTTAGRPAVDAVSEIVGKPVTRAQITQAAPDGKRPDPEPQ